MQGLIVLGLILTLYFLPAIIGRKKRNARAIMWLNFFLGWTFIGWVVALVWAMTKDPELSPLAVNQSVPMHCCPSCGRYLPSSNQFCVWCGAKVVV